MTLVSTLRALLAALLLAPLAAAAQQSESERVWGALKQGGNVVLVRHGLTTPGVGDPPEFRLEDCKTQRNLTDVGRREARKLGEAFRERGIRVDRIFSSPWCRCMETARIAFGPPEAWKPLSNLFGRPEARDEQVQEMRAKLGERRPGVNIVWVSHGSTISAATGVSPDTAEMVVVSPRGGGKFEVIGRLKVPS